MKTIFNNQRGISTIEVLIVLVTIGVMAWIVDTTYTGIQAKSNNSTRATDINTIQEHIETFYSQNMYYPTLADMNNSSWVTTNLKGLDQSVMQDPSWTNKNKLCNINSQPVFLVRSQPGCYGYNPTNNGASCAAKANTCNDYVLSASLQQGGGVYTKRQLN